jgi:ethanolamine utilization protein EutM
MTLALGLIETKGLIGAIEAADAMVKAANVEIIGREKITAALITIKIAGEVAAVKAAVDAGAAAAQRVGELVSTHVIPKPDDEISTILPEMEKYMESSVPAGGKKRKTKEKKETLKEERTFSLFDQGDFDEPELFLNADSDAFEEGAPETDETWDFSGDEEAAEELTDITEAEQPVISGEEEISIEEEMTEETEISPIEAEETAETVEAEALVESEQDEITATMEIPGPHDEVIQTAAKEEIIEEKENIKELSEEEPEKISTIEKLRREALTESETAPEDEKNEAAAGAHNLGELEKMNVHELRKYARSSPDFPIQGREISKANRQALLDYFRKLI